MRKKKKSEGVRWIFSTVEEEEKEIWKGRKKKDDRFLCFSVRTTVGRSHSRCILRGVETEKKGETPRRPPKKGPSRLQLAAGVQDE